MFGGNYESLRKILNCAKCKSQILMKKKALNRDKCFHFVTLLEKIINNMLPLTFVKGECFTAVTKFKH